MFAENKKDIKSKISRIGKLAKQIGYRKDVSFKANSYLCQIEIALIEVNSEIEVYLENTNK